MTLVNKDVRELLEQAQMQLDGRKSTDTVEPANDLALIAIGYALVELKELLNERLK